MRRHRLIGLTLTAALCAAVVPFAVSAQADSQCEWLAGDFHVHTVYSHDSYGGPQDDETGPEDFYTFGWTPGQQGAIAESRELDFIAITDHNNVHGYEQRNAPATGVGLWESGWGGDTFPGEHPLIWVPDYENSVSGAGHAQMHGATHIYDQSLKAPDAAAAIRADGGAFQINHPADMDWHDDEGNYEYPGFAPDALEIWNIGAWFYEPFMPATNDHEFPVAMYDDFLDLGFNVAATGGSDNHWRSTTSVQGVGQPTTWVCARPAEEGEDPWKPIVEGVLANRTMISNQPPAYMGPTAKLYADGDGDGDFESMLGDTAEIGEETTIQAVVENAEGATLRLLTNGGEPLTETTIDDFNYSTTVAVPPDSTWVRAEVFYEDGREHRRDLQPLCDLSEELLAQFNEAIDDNSPFDKENVYCENRLAMIAMTSPIYFQAPEPEFDQATTLTYDGTTQAKVGSRITLAATLLDSTGAPLVGQAVVFTFRDATYNAMTDANGRAQVSNVKVSGPPGSYDVISDFAGTDTNDASHDHDVVTVTPGQ